MVLLTLASRQIWPQVLAVAHLRPERLILLHGDDLAESKGPAERLKRFFAAERLMPPETVHLERVPHDEFSAIERRFDEIVASRRLNLEECLVNITGGNKLMATALFRRAARRGVRAFYLERDNSLTWFEPADGDMDTRVEKLPVGATNPLDAAALLSCQFGDDVVQFPGERLTLNELGGRVSPQDLAAKLAGETLLGSGGFDFRKWLRIDNASRRKVKAGDNLEYGVACALLHAGVDSVRRGVELATLPSSPNSEGELDLVFNWNGRLWVVDCKDRVGGEAKVEALRKDFLMLGGLPRGTRELLESIEDDLKDRDIKILREDLLQVAEVGGLLGCALAVRKAQPPRQAVEFAASRHPRVEILMKQDLVRRLPAILAGRRAR